MDEIDRRIIQLEMERLSLQSDFDAENGPTEELRLSSLDQELEDLRVQQAELNLKWTLEKGGVDRLKEIKNEIADVQNEIDKAERDFDLNKAAELKYAKMPELEKELAELEAISDEQEISQGGERMLRDEVVADDIANVVAIWTGIPPGKLLESERDRILSMGNELRDRVVGQDEAIEVVTQAVQRSRAGLNDPNKPIASMMFLGPTGVGKTELCKALSEFMFDSEDALIRFDMSEYGEKHTVSRLIGAAPGYVGYEEGGQLTDAVRRKPYSVLLFDEVEKGHPDVFNIFLQLLDDGRLTDSKGNHVNFKNCVVIFTSNIGSSDILELNGSSEEGAKEEMRSRVTEAMRKHFKPEFLNRIDENVIFNSLGKEALREIVKIEVSRLEKRLNEKNIQLSMKEEALDFLADVGFDPIYGARPLKRTIQRELETIIARGILGGQFNDGDTVVVGVMNERLDITRAVGGTPQPPTESQGGEQFQTIPSFE